MRYLNILLMILGSITYAYDHEPKLQIMLPGQYYSDKNVVEHCRNQESENAQGFYCSTTSFSSVPQSCQCFYNHEQIKTQVALAMMKASMSPAEFQEFIGQLHVKQYGVSHEFLWGSNSAKGLYQTRSFITVENWIVQNKNLTRSQALNVWKGYCDKRWGNGRSKQEGFKRIQLEFDWRDEQVRQKNLLEQHQKAEQEKRDRKKRETVEQEKIAQLKLSQKIQQQEEIQVSNSRTQEFLAQEYDEIALKFSDDQSPDSFDDNIARCDALQQTIEQNYAQFDQNYELSQQTLGYLHAQGFNPVAYLNFYGTALQQQLHSQTCQIFDQTAQLQRSLRYQSSMLFSILQVADAAYDANRQEQIRIVQALLDVDCGLFKLIRPYAQAIERGIISSAADFVHMSAHPFETIKAIAKSLCFILETVELNDPENFIGQPAVMKLRDQRNAHIDAALIHLGHQFQQADGPARVEALTRFGVDFVVPEKIIHAVGGVLGIIKSQARTMRTIEAVAAGVGEEFGFEHVAEEIAQAGKNIEHATQESIAQQLGEQLMEAESQINNITQLIRPATFIIEEVRSLGGIIPFNKPELLREVKLMLEKVANQVNKCFDKKLNKYSKKTIFKNEIRYDVYLDMKHVLNLVNSTHQCNTNI